MTDNNNNTPVNAEPTAPTEFPHTLLIARLLLGVYEEFLKTRDNPNSIDEEDFSDQEGESNDC